MDIVLVIAAVIVVALVVLLVVPYLYVRRKTARTLGDFEEYMALRRQCRADPRWAADRAHGAAADEISARLGPRFDPRLSAWSRLGSAEPRLMAYVTQYIDPTVEEPMDLEAFADSMLLLTLSPPDVVHTGHWQAAMQTCGELAAEWRLDQPGRYSDAAIPPMDRALDEAFAVTTRFFRSGSWRWDFAKGVAVEQPGGPSANPRVTPLAVSTGAASAWEVSIAPELSPPSPGGGPRPGSGPYQTRADRTLQLDAGDQIGFQVGFLSRFRPMPDLKDAYVTSIVPMDASAWPGEPFPAQLVTPGTWFERWTLDCAGTRLPFAVAFMPDPKGGTNLTAALIE